MKTRIMLIALLTVVPAGAAILQGTLQSGNGLDFQDVPAKARQFMAYNQEIKLSPEQEEIRKAALTKIAAPCCSNYSAYTCCCKCNLSRTVWGLSKFLIAKQGKDAAQVGEAVTKWIDAMNPQGFSGSACFQNGGCNRPFRKDGCGGMQADHLIY